RSRIARLNNPTGGGITSTPIISIEVGGSYTYQISASSTPTSIAVFNLPSWLSFDNVDTISGTAPATPQTTGTITIEATFPWGIFQQQFEVIVGIAPQITSSVPTSASVGQLYTYTITASGDP